MLFATEGFESFNAVIRSHSVHSNRHAPSRDIARSMAQCNRVRHLLSGGLFLVHAVDNFSQQGSKTKDLLLQEAEAGRSPWRHRVQGPVGEHGWRAIGQLPRRLLKVDFFASRILGMENLDDDVDTDVNPGQHLGGGYPIVTVAFASHTLNYHNILGQCSGLGQLVFWKNIRCGDPISGIPPPHTVQVLLRCIRLASKVSLPGVGLEMCAVGGWVLWRTGDEDADLPPKISRVVEIVQIDGTLEAHRGEASFVAVEEANLGGPHELYNMPQVTLLGTIRSISPKVGFLNLLTAGKLTNIICDRSTQDILGAVNVQHSCRDHGCPVTRTRTVYQEREKTTQLSHEVTHKPHGDYILNTAQMRNSFLIQPLRALSPRLDRSQIIHQAVAIEVDAAKVREQAALSPPILQQDPAPRTSSTSDQSRLSVHPPLTSSESAQAGPSSSTGRPFHQLYSGISRISSTYIPHLAQPSYSQLYTPSRPSPLTNHTVTQFNNYSSQPPSSYQPHTRSAQPYYSRPPHNHLSPQVVQHQQVEQQGSEGGSSLANARNGDTQYFAPYPSEPYE